MSRIRQRIRAFAAKGWHLVGTVRDEAQRRDLRGPRFRASSIGRGSPQGRPSPTSGGSQLAVMNTKEAL
jgi:hypothetical protein